MELNLERMGVTSGTGRDVEAVEGTRKFCVKDMGVTSGTGCDVEAVEGARREFCVKDMGSEMCARAVRPPH